jgi:putative transcriptional regulator
MFPVTPGEAYAGAVGAIGLLTPGTIFPHHAHVGDEVTLVLDGGFRDEDGREIWRGEELYKPAGSDHEFVVIGERPCIAAVLALGGVRFR